MGNRAKSQFYSIFSIYFTVEQIIIGTLFFGKFLFKREKHAQKFKFLSLYGIFHQIPAQNGGMKVLLRIEEMNLEFCYTYFNVKQI
jgi:hypothetical protein